MGRGAGPDRARSRCDVAIRNKKGVRIKIPKGFPDFFGSRDVAMVDSLIVRLLAARADLRHPAWGPWLRETIAKAWAAVAAFGDARSSADRRRELMVHALDLSTRVSNELRV